MWHPKNSPLKKNYKAGQSPLWVKIPLKKISWGGQSPPKIQALICALINFKNPKDTSTPPKGCVCQKLEKSMHWLQSSDTDVWMRDGQTDIRGDTNNNTYPAPTSSGGG